MNMSNKNKKPSRVQRHVAKRGITRVARQVSCFAQEDVNVHVFKIEDGYHQPWYRLERYGSRLLGARMEAYLTKRSYLDFAHPKNKARKILYTLPSFSEWATLMPGALALEPIHHPEQKRLTTGKRLDPLTRRLFRHALDPVGVRTRTLLGAWLAHHHIAQKPGKPIHWLSMAGGTAAPSMLMVNASSIDKRLLHYTDIDQDGMAIDIARDITAHEGLRPQNTTLLTGDIFNDSLYVKAGSQGQFDVIEMMGIFEYMDDAKATRLLKLAWEHLKEDGIIIAGNMRSEHPQLNLHKRGIGWPDVLPRRVADIIRLCRQAGIPINSLDVYQPLDGVYNVFRVRKQG